MPSNKYTIAANNGWKWNAEQLNRSVNALDVDKMRAPLNIVVVNTLDHFPLQTSTTITLQSGFRYIIGSTITTSKRFIVQDGVDISAGALSPLTLIYTGTGDMFTSVNASWTISDITYSCPNGRVFNCSGTGIIINERTSCVQVKDLGMFTGAGFSNVNFSNFNYLNCTGQGFQFFGTFFVLHLSKMYVNSTSSSFVGIDLDSSLSSDVELDNVEMYGVSGGIAIKGTTNSGNITSGSVATVKNSTLNGGSIAPMSGISISDIRWDFSGNSGVEETIEDALIYFNGNVTPTVISATSSNGSNSVNINATWLLGRVSKFTFTSDGLITYTGERPITVPIDITVNVKATNGTPQECNIYLVKDGTVIAATKRGDEITNTKSKQIFNPWQMTLNYGDTLRVKVENATGVNNVLCEQGTIRIR